MNRWRRNCWFNCCQCDGRNNNMSNYKKESKECYDNSKWEKKQEFEKKCCCCCKCEDKYEDKKEKCGCEERFPKCYHKKEKFPKHECKCCSEYDKQECDYDNEYFECNDCYVEY